MWTTFTFSFNKLTLTLMKLSRLTRLTNRFTSQTAADHESFYGVLYPSPHAPSSPGPSCQLSNKFSVSLNRERVGLTVRKDRRARGLANVECTVRSLMSEPMAMNTDMAEILQEKRKWKRARSEGGRVC